MKIGIAQIAPVFGHWEANVRKHKEYIQLAQSNHIDLLVFPEMSLTGYSLKDAVSEVALSLDDPRINEFSELSASIDIVAGFAELIPGKGFAISSAYFHQGYLLHVHRKVYLPINGMFDDLKDFRSGDSIRAFPVREWNCGILICRDIWHMDAVQALAFQNTQLLIAPSAVPLRSIGPTGPNIHAFMKRTAQSYAEHHTLYFIYANRVGFEEGICFYGGSMIADPFGQVIAQGGFLEEELIVAEVSMDEIHRRISCISLKHEENPSLLLTSLDEEELQ